MNPKLSRIRQRAVERHSRKWLAEQERVAALHLAEAEKLGAKLGKKAKATAHARGFGARLHAKDRTRILRAQ